MMNILIIEDESNIASFIYRGLSEEGYNPSLAMDGKTGLDMIENHPYDLIILDIPENFITRLQVLKGILMD